MENPANQMPPEGFKRRMAETATVCGHELKRMVHTPRACLLLLLYLLIACLCAFIFHHLYGALDSLGAVIKRSASDPQAAAMVYRKSLEQFFSKDASAIEWLVQMPPFVLFSFKFNCAFLPALAILTGFDMMSSEFEAKSMRYLTTRVHRSNVLAGKVLANGVAIAVLTTILAILAPVFGLFFDMEVPVPNDASLAVQIMGMVRLQTTLLMILVPYLCLTSLFSSLTKTPIYSLILSFAALAGLFILKLLALWDRFAFLKWLVPASYEDGFLSSNVLTVAGSMAATVAFSAAFLGLGILRLRKADL